MMELPGGTVTFLFSDIESSTLLLRQLEDDWEHALVAHNRILRESFAESGGHEVDRQGDAFFAVFPTARTALASAAAAQRSLAAHDWPRGAMLRVRMGIHTGEPSVGGEGYLGVDVVRAARICSAANGGQVLVSESVRALVGGSELRDLGLHHLKDMEHPERLFQLVLADLPDDFAAPRALDRPQAPAPPAFELASQSAALAERFAGIGPQIEQHVQAALAAKGIAPGPTHPRELARPDRGQAKTGTALVGVVAVTLLIVFGSLTLIVYLILQAL